jgi:hypothetical protein
VEREYASFWYGWPPNMVEIYLKQLPLVETESKAFRQELLKFGIFKEAGLWTLRATVESGNKQTVEEVYNLTLAKVAKMLSAAHQTTL